MNKRTQSPYSPFQNLLRGLTLVSLMLLAAPFFPAHADNLNNTIVRIDRMVNGVPTSGTVCVAMKTTGSSDAFLEVTFPTGFTLNSTVGNWTVTTTNLPAGSSAMPGINTVGAGGISGQIARFPITDITDSALYCFNFNGTNTLSTGGGVGSDKQGSVRVYTGGTAAVGSGSIVDEGNYATAIIAGDQAVITATVPPTFSFILGNLAQGLGILSSSAITPSNPGITVQVGTNANNGWTAWIKSLNQALTSATTGDSIPTITAAGANANETVSIGVNGYVLDSNLTTDGAGGGVVSIPAEYSDGDNTGVDPGTLDHGGSLFANFAEVGSSTGPTAADVITLIARVTISAMTQAATDYTDTLTIVGAGNF